MPYQFRRSLLALPLLALIAAGCSNTPPHQRASGTRNATTTTAVGQGMPNPQDDMATVAPTDGNGRAGTIATKQGGAASSVTSTPTSRSSGGTTTTTSLAAGGGSCPDPRYCPKYALDVPWQTDAQGRVTIHYRVNPMLPAIATFTVDQFTQAVQDAAKAWMDSDPDKVFLIYDGTTNDAPSEFNNVIGFAPSDTSYVVRSPLTGNYKTSFNMVLSTNKGWDYRRCHPPAVPCDPYESDAASDLASILAHEWGHVLGHGEMTDSDGRDMTMNPSGGVDKAGVLNRKQVTLGLGDVLGVRHLYPTSVGMPILYSP